MRIHALCAAVSIALAAAAAPARAEIDEDRYRSPEWRIAMRLPTSWQTTEQTSYPNILLWLVRHNPDAKLLLAAEPVAAELDAKAYAEATIERLHALGFEVRPPQLHAATGAYYMDFDDGRTFLRQAVLVVGGAGFSLTLAAEDSTSRGQLLRVFDEALRSLRPITKAEADEAAAAEAAREAESAPDEEDAAEEAP